MRKEGKYFIIILVCLIVVGLLYLLAPILTPFFFGAFLAYLADPLVVKLTQRGLSRNGKCRDCFSEFVSAVNIDYTACHSPDSKPIIYFA